MECYNDLKPWPACPHCKIVLAEPWLYAQPHVTPDGQPCKSVVVHRTYFTDEHLVDGDNTSDDRTYEVFPCIPDTWDLEEGLTCVNLAVGHMDEAGTGDPSSTKFHPGLWYTYADGSWVQNHHTGERCEPSSHLYGFTPEEEKQVWELMTKETS